jgi:signal transduction histidine kinase
LNLHNLLPLVAFLLNVSLAGVALLRNPGSRLNRVFSYFVLAMAAWNLGVFMLRRTPSAEVAYSWEILLHVGVILIPVFYYHFVLIFLDATIPHRPSLSLAYALSAVFLAFDLSGSPLFLRGVKDTYWGWAADGGPAYLIFFAFFNATFAWGLFLLVAEFKHIDSSFRRNRARLIQIGTVITVTGGVVDFLRVIVPGAERIYPLAIPANMLFALMLATSIVRYRLFDVTTAVKRAAVYAGVCGLVTSLLVVMTRTAERLFDLGSMSPLWMVVPLGFLITALLSPLGQTLEDRIQRLMFSKRRGCYDTLLALSKRMSAILEQRKLVDTLVQGLVRGIPLTHCVLMLYDRPTNSYVLHREETTGETAGGVATLRADSPIVQWLLVSGEVLVKEEVKLNPRMARYFEDAEGELEAVNASLIVPLKIEMNLIGILLIGEKLSGDIFDAQELEVLSVLANQAAISLGNALLYEELGTTNARLLQANQLKSQFLASMSHELRTPLNSIIGFSKVLLNRLDGDLTERQETYIRSVHKSGTHLLGLINSILDFSRIEAGKVEVHAEEIDVAELVAECIESSLPLVRGKPLKVEKDVPRDLPPILADRTKVKQILLNLLGNAIKFTASGRVLVRVQGLGEQARVSVVDTGIGIREDDLPRLFEPFHRLHNAMSLKVGGTGLGLAISKRFVELQGGTIWAESRENQGSTFHFTLPLARTPAALAAAPASGPPGPAAAAPAAAAPLPEKVGA